MRFSRSRSRVAPSLGRGGVLRAAAALTLGGLLGACDVTDVGTPVLHTLEVVSPYTDHAFVSGEIVERGAGRHTNHGFAWATHPGPTVAHSALSLGAPVGVGTFEGTMAGLAQNTTYYVRAFLQTDGAGTVYGNEVSFTTAAENTWVERSALMGGPLSAAVSFVLYGRIYVGTGIGHAYSASFYEYDYRRDTWTQVAPLPASPRAYAVAFSTLGYGYVGLGNTCVGTGLCTHQYFNDLWRYDSGTNSWTRMADLPVQGRAFSVAFVIGGNAYVTGGSTVNDRGLWRYNATNDTWAQLADYPGACISRGTAFAVGNKGYVGLGWTDGSCDDLWKYDPADDSWTQMADFPGVPRYHAVGFARGDEGFVACGVNQRLAQPLGFQTDLWKYDPSADAWTKLETAYAGAGRIEMVQGILHDRVFMGLGATDIAHGPEDRFADFWEYIPTSTPSTSSAARAAHPPSTHVVR